MLNLDTFSCSLKFLQQNITVATSNLIYCFVSSVHTEKCDLKAVCINGWNWRSAMSDMSAVLTVSCLQNLLCSSEWMFI